MHDRVLENHDDEDAPALKRAVQMRGPLKSSHADADVIGRLRAAGRGLSARGIVDTTATATATATASRRAGAEHDITLGLAPTPARPNSYGTATTVAHPTSPPDAVQLAPRPLAPNAYGGERSPSQKNPPPILPPIPKFTLAAFCLAPTPMRPSDYRVIDLLIEPAPPEHLSPLPLRPAEFGSVIDEQSPAPALSMTLSIAAPLPARPASYASAQPPRAITAAPPPVDNAIPPPTALTVPAAPAAPVPMRPTLAAQAFDAPIGASQPRPPALDFGLQTDDRTLSERTAPAASADTQPRQSFAARLVTVLRRGAIIAALSLVAWLVVMAALIGLYRFVDPPSSTLMASQWATGTTIDQRWRAVDALSPNLVRAVLVSEDWRFCQHYGVDLAEIEAAIARARNGTPRGASTMTMQVAKNLFLWPAKSYVRKALEVPLTLMIETFWSKRRIAEVYLNIAEWGPGIFGAEAAARYHFGKSAAALNVGEAALLAVALPNPFSRVAGKPGRGTRSLARTVRARMRQAGSATNCILPR